MNGNTHWVSAAILSRSLAVTGMMLSGAVAA